MFRKTIPNRISQDLINQIQNAILNGSLKPGDRLPSQRELQETFQTSRATIREALRVLEHKGLVEIKLGVAGGAVVKDLTAQTITDSLNLLIQYQKVTLDHLVEFRELVEGNVAALAAQRASKTDVTALERILKTAAKGAPQGTRDWRALMRADEKIHITLAQIAANPIFIAVLNMVHANILGSYEQFALKSPDALEDNYQDLCRIVAAVAQGDADRARDLSQQHVRRFIRLLKHQGRQAAKEVSHAKP